MALNGELEHFPLVDVIQLLHMTAKTGILYLRSARGESQLVFHQGFLVSASHLNGSVRIGKVLIDMGAIDEDALKAALLVQEMAGRWRKPLVATLIEQGLIDQETAFKGLEKLIGMTMLEVLSWKKGSFTFDPSTAKAFDEYRYFPEQLHMGILLNAQGVLMDSLRIYDEMVREGTLEQLLVEPADGEGLDFGTVQSPVRCLEALDTLSRRVQEVLSGLKERVGAAAGGAEGEATADHQQELVTYLTGLSRDAAAKPSREQPSG